MKALAIVISLSALVCSSVAQSLRSQINSADKKVQKFMMANDAKGFKSYLKTAVTSDFQYVEAGQKMGFDEMCDHVTQGMSQMHTTKASSKILSLHQKGNMATASIMHKMQGKTSGPDHKTHMMSFEGVSMDTYVKQGGKWKMSRMEWGKQTMKMDGKPMNMNAAGGEQSK